jgi:hypothetical protein
MHLSGVREAFPFKLRMKGACVHDCQSDDENRMVISGVRHVKRKEGQDTILCVCDFLFYPDYVAICSYPTPSTQLFFFDL